MTLKAARFFALRDAAGVGDVRLCKILIEQGADVDLPITWTPLHAACANGQEAAARLLLKAGARLNVGPNTALMLAADRSDVALCQFLVDAGADVSTPGENGVTPLMRVAKRGDAHMVRFFISSGADVHAAQKEGWSALMYAASNDHVEVVKLLIDAGVAPGLALFCETLPQLTAFQMAVRFNSIKVMEFFLLDCGEDPAQRTAAGRTMRQLAGKHVEAKQLLLSARAAASVNSSVGVQCHQEAGRPGLRSGASGPI